MADNDGGAIYPVIQAMHATCVPGEPCRVSAGLTIRDFFAAAAVQGLMQWNAGALMMVKEVLRIPSDDAEEVRADIAYRMADAMMKARAERRQEQSG